MENASTILKGCLRINTYMTLSQLITAVGIRHSLSNDNIARTLGGTRALSQVEAKKFGFFSFIGLGTTKYRLRNLPVIRIPGRNVLFTNIHNRYNFVGLMPPIEKVRIYRIHFCYVLWLPKYIAKGEKRIILDPKTSMETAANLLETAKPLRLWDPGVNRNSRC